MHSGLVISLVLLSSLFFCWELHFSLGKTEGMIKMIISRSEIKRMSFDTRLARYEQDKKEVMQDKSLTTEERLEILESLREKWLI